VNASFIPVLNATLSELGCFTAGSMCELQSIASTDWNCTRFASNLVCDTSGNVVRVILLSALTGSISSMIGLMTSLQSITFANLGLSGTIPTDVGRLRLLTNLALDSNFLSGTVPSELALLTVLSSLGLEANMLTGPIPSQIAMLGALVYLDIYDNRLNGTLPTIVRWTNLVELYLSMNALTGNIPSSLLASLTLLESLYGCCGLF